MSDKPLCSKASRCPARGRTKSDRSDIGPDIGKVRKVCLWLGSLSCGSDGSPPRSSRFNSMSEIWKSVLGYARATGMVPSPLLF